MLMKKLEKQHYNYFKKYATPVKKPTGMELQGTRDSLVKFFRDFEAVEASL